MNGRTPDRAPGVVNSIVINGINGAGLAAGLARRVLSRARFAAGLAAELGGRASCD